MVGRAMQNPYAMSLLITSSLYERATVKDGCGNSNAAGLKSFTNSEGNSKEALSQEAVTSAV